MFKNLGTVEIIIIAVVLIVIFGGKKLPELARGLGESGRELKKAKRDIIQALEDDEPEAQPKKNCLIN